jgi:hypothetical protein
VRRNSSKPIQAASAAACSVHLTKSSRRLRANLLLTTLVGSKQARPWWIGGSTPRPDDDLADPLPHLADPHGTCHATLRLVVAVAYRRHCRLAPAPRKDRSTSAPACHNWLLDDAAARARPSHRGGTRAPDDCGHTEACSGSTPTRATRTFVR